MSPIKVELKEYIGRSGTHYYVVYSDRTHWHVFIKDRGETRFIPFVAKDAARDCGVVFEDNPNTHTYMKELEASNEQA
jgi:hypothetical protein